MLSDPIAQKPVIFIFSTVPVDHCERDCHYKFVSDIIEENNGSILEDEHTGKKATSANYTNIYVG